MLPETVACFVTMTRRFMETHDGKAFTSCCFLKDLPFPTMIELSAGRATGLQNAEQLYMIARSIEWQNAGSAA